MTTIQSIPGAADAGVFNSATAIPLPEVYTIRPMIKIPRSAQRDYSDSEMSTAAAMLAKMRKRGDVIDELRSLPQPVPMNSDHALDRVVDKLLELI